MSSAYDISLAYCRCQDINIPNPLCLAQHHGRRPTSPSIGSSTSRSSSIRGLPGPRRVLAAPLSTRSSSTFQQRPAPTLFDGLLFNREQVYGGGSVSSNRPSRSLTVVCIENSYAAQGTDPRHRPLPPTSNEQDEEGFYSNSSSGLEILQPLCSIMASANSKPMAPKKKMPTKGTFSDTKPSTTPKKRPGTEGLVRVVRKKPYNKPILKKKVDSVEPVSVSKKRPLSDPIVIDSDSEDDTPFSREVKRMKEDEEQRLVTLTNDWSCSKVESSETEPDTPLLTKSNLRNNSARMEPKHETELQRLRKELEDAKAHASTEVESVRRDMQKKLNDAEVQRAQAVLQMDQKYAALEQKLAREQAETRAVTVKHDEMRVELEASNKRCNNLRRELEEQGRVKDKVSENHTRVQEALIKTKDAELAAAMSTHHKQITTLEAENTRNATELLSQKELVSTLQTKFNCLRQELSNLKAENSRLQRDVSGHTAQTASMTTVPSTSTPSRTSTISCSSPAPSSAGTLADDDIKTDNVRKMYTKVKQRFNNLHGAAVNVAHCANYMDLTKFGEFGKHVKQLKTVLEEDGQERQGSVVARKESGDVDHRFGV